MGSTMKQAIFQVLEPRYKGSTTGDQRQALSKISDIAKKTIEQGKGLEVLGDYAWLCSLETGLPAIAGMIYFADHVNLPYRITYLENELKWDYFDSENLLSDK